MTQVIDIISDALGHLRVIDADSAVPESDVKEGIRTLNNMLRKWESEGITLGWSDVSKPDDLMPSPAEADEAIAYNLAVRLRSKYGTAADADVIHFANDGLALLRAQVASSLYERLTYPDLPAGVGSGGLGGWRAGFTR